VRGIATGGVSLVIRLLLVLVAFVVLAPLGCGQASSPAERQEKRAGVEQGEPADEPQPAPEPTTASADGTAVGEAFVEAELRPMGGSGVSGDVAFREVGSLGVQVELSASGLPNPENSEAPEPYFAQVHEGSCAEAPKGDDQEHREDHGDDHHGHNHEHGGLGLSLALLRPGPLVAKVYEYADHAEYEAPPADELPGNLDSPIEIGASADGTGAVTSLLEGVKPEQLSSGGPKYIDLRAPSHEAPEEWPLLACANLSEGG
jgi:hypothetical protein